MGDTRDRERGGGERKRGGETKQGGGKHFTTGLPPFPPQPLSLSLNFLSSVLLRRVLFKKDLGRGGEQALRAALTVQAGASRRTTGARGAAHQH